MNEINKKLEKIQKELKAPKGQVNTFGNFNYRSCEDILEAIKPLLDGCVVLLSDEIVLVGERYYVKATATFTDGTDRIEVTASARESLDKKGMDSAQITGASSSYARKYALIGLFLIDDTKVEDTTTVNRSPDPKRNDKGNFGKTYYEKKLKDCGLEVGQKQPLCPQCDIKMNPAKKKDGTGSVWYCPNFKEKGCSPIDIKDVDTAGNIIK